MWRDGAGSFAAGGRDAGVNTGAPGLKAPTGRTGRPSWHLGIFMPGGMHRRSLPEQGASRAETP